MKNIFNVILIGLFIFVMLIACEKERENLPKPVPPKYTADEVDKMINTEYAWGVKNPVWDIALYDAVKKSEINSKVKIPCKKLNAKECLAQTISIMAKYESSFKPETIFYECSKKSNVYGKTAFYDKERGWCMKGVSQYDGGFVISRGLLQISIASAKSYGCPIEKSTDLHNAQINLECGVKIATNWINKDGVFFGGDKLGIGRYWSVGRKSSPSNTKILKYLENY
jgi:hypothetical protein